MKKKRYSDLCWQITNPTNGKEFPGFAALHSRLDLRFRSRIAAALCRASGSRGLPRHAPHYQADDEARAGRLRHRPPRFRPSLAVPA